MGRLQGSAAEEGFHKLVSKMGMKPSRMMGDERVRHCSVNQEGSEFYKRMRAKAQAKEEADKKRILAAQIVTEESAKVEEEGGGDDGEEISSNFFEAQDWKAPTVRSNFFEEHDEWEGTEEAEDDPSGLPSQLKYERPSNVGPTT